jgi:hypothetical protein
MKIGTIIEMSMCCRTDATAATMAVPAGASMEPFERRADAPDVVLGGEGKYVEVVLGREEERSWDVTQRHAIACTINVILVADLEDDLTVST